MSYSATISFKRLPANEIMQFLKDFKKAATERLEAIAENEYLYCPYIRDSLTIPEDFAQVSREEREKAIVWAKTSVFTFRYFYDKELSLLGVFGVDNALSDLFNKTIYFQNSTDQNYERKDWEGIPEFEQIYDRWLALSPDELIQEYDRRNPAWSWAKDYEKSDAEALEYQAKVFAYDEIWSRYNGELYDDSSAIYFSLYGYYDLMTVEKFVIACHKAQVKNQKEWEAKDAANPNKGLFAIADVFPTKWDEKFLEDISLGFTDQSASAEIFLHGICGVFALALHDEFGYEIRYGEALAEPEEEYEDDEDNGLVPELIHIYCVDTDGSKVDIRGRTKNNKLFWSSFEDFFTDGPREQTYSEAECRDFVVTCMGEDEFSRYYKAAKRIIRTNLSWYKKGE